MKRILCTLAAFLLAGVAVFAQGVVGKWKLDDGSAVVEVYKAGDDVYNGRIVWLAEPYDANGAPIKDGLNPDESLRGREIMGLNMLSGLTYNGKEYTGGKIYDPSNGKTYNCSMKLNGNVLKVRGSLDKRGLVGRTMDWIRVEE